MNNCLCCKVVEFDVVEVDADASKSGKVQIIVDDADASISGKVQLLVEHMLIRNVVVPAIQRAVADVSSRQHMLISICTTVGLRPMPATREWRVVGSVVIWLMPCVFRCAVVDVVE